MAERGQTASGAERALLVMLRMVTNAAAHSVSVPLRATEMSTAATVSVMPGRRTRARAMRWSPRASVRNLAV